MSYHPYLIGEAVESLREIKHPFVDGGQAPEGSHTGVSAGIIFQCDHVEEGKLKFYVVQSVD